MTYRVYLLSNLSHGGVTLADLWHQVLVKISPSKFSLFFFQRIKTNLLILVPCGPRTELCDDL